MRDEEKGWVIRGGGEREEVMGEGERCRTDGFAFPYGGFENDEKQREIEVTGLF